MGKRSVSIAWKVLLVYGLYTIMLGLIALVLPARAMLGGKAASR